MRNLVEIWMKNTYEVAYMRGVLPLRSVVLALAPASKSALMH